MFVDSVDVINCRLENININVQNNMHPKSNRPPTCPKTQVPHLNITLSTANQRRTDGSPQQGAENPWLLKPQHEIPPTPPPQVDEQTGNFFKRAG
ncbi:uncharacterized protein [Epargyreus clarus]|uniref:uncharacterized protein n=1 Tax=Epargyreus clarus TaxID=520877 RepID=UPI003C2E67FD